MEQDKNEEKEPDWKEEIKRDLERGMEEEVIPEEVAVPEEDETASEGKKEESEKEESKKEESEKKAELSSGEKLTEDKNAVVEEIAEKEPSEEVLNNPAKDLSKKREPGKTVQQPILASVARVLTWIGTALAVLLGTLAMLIGRSVFWVLETWHSLTMEELIFHIQAPLEGTNEGLIKEYITSCVVISLVVFVVLIAVFVYLRKKRNIYYSVMMGVMLVSIVSGFLCLRHIWNELDVSAYRNNQTSYSSFIDDYYVDPKDVSIQFPEQKRNLIYIYLESMETTYADEENGGAFEENIIPELTELSNKYENFSGDHKNLNGGYSATGTTWTIGALFGQTSGLPLLIPIERSSMNTQEHFFPEIVTMGDILEEQGYNQNFMIGSVGDFGGRQLYFEEHGDYNIYDYYYAVDNKLIPEDYYVWWGYEDKYLFEYAKDKITDLAAGDEPFNFTMLTVDTHFEDGYVCTDCGTEYGDNQYANVMRCSSRKVADLVEWIQQQDFYENTTIVIAGDHPTMDGDFCEDVDEEYTRKVYTAYINSAVEVQNDSKRQYATFDNFPTTLASLGASIEGNRLGLGTNLFSNIQTLSERFGYEKADREIAKKSKIMERLTSTIEVKEPEVVPTVTADIEVTPYDFMVGKFTVNISNVNSNVDIQAIRCAIWAEEDQSDLIWYEAQLREDGIYATDVLASDFGYKQSTYNIYVYAIDSDGQTILINGATGMIN